MQEGDEEPCSWQEFFKNNRVIPPFPSRRKDGVQQGIPFCLQLKVLEGIPLPEDVDPGKVEFQVRITFYDAANHWFFGSTWIGPLCSAEEVIDNKIKVAYNEPLYFHSSLNDYTIVAVLELAVSDGNNNLYQTIGWSILRLFSQTDKLKDISQTRQMLQLRLDVFCGTPTTLMLIEEPIEECASLSKIPECFIRYSIHTHIGLDKVMHLIPENVVISGDDIVPGVSEVGADSTTGVIDILRQPKLLKSWPCYINKLCVMLHPSVDKFEEKLCNLLNEDRLKKNDIGSDGSVVSIAERRLLVGVHNGWTFVKPYHIAYLEKDYGGDEKGRGRTSSFTGSINSNQSKQCRCLSLRSRLELDEMVNHPLFAIVFQVEYVVNIPVMQPELPTGKKARSKLGSSYGSMPLSQKQEVAIRWIVWVPFENGPFENKEISLDFDGGPGGNPTNVFSFSKTIQIAEEEISTKSQGQLQFSFTQARIKSNQFMRLQSSGYERPASGTITELSVQDRPPSSVGTASFLGDTIGGKPPIPFRSRPETPPSLYQQQNMQPYGTAPQIAIHKPSTDSPDLPQLPHMPHTQQYTPIIATTPYQHTSGTTTLSRAAYATLHSAGFPAIVDQHGNPPFPADPAELVKYDLEKESMDPLQCNEIVFQFMAMSRCNHRTVFFSYQFYRFPQVSTERMCLKNFGSNESGSVPCLLQKCDRDGKATSSSPGLLLRYNVDPAYLQPGEKNSFLKYLLQQKLYIDVWDGDSLLLIGSTSVELKHLLRQCQSAVQVSHELDVISMEYSEHNPVLPGDFIQSGRSYPTGVKLRLEAKLNIRLANVGTVGELNSTRAGTMPQMKSAIIIPERSSGPVNLSGTSPALRKSKAVKAKLMADCDAELAAVLFTRKDQILQPMTKTNVRQSDAVRKRKLERIRAVRQIQGGDTVSNAFVLQKEDKLQRTRDLKTIQLYREKCKHEGIINLLEDGITTHHTIHASLGTSEFFEFALKNPYPLDQTIQILVLDRDLSIITDAREWKYYKRIIETRTALEENMFSNIESTIQLFVKGHETVYVPFKFQNFKTENITPETGPIHPLTYKDSTNSLTRSFGRDTGLSSKTIKVSFVTIDQKPIAILSLHVELHPHIIDQTFRFHHAEQSFLKKSVRLPPWHTLTTTIVTEGQTTSSISVRCTDPDVICETHDMQDEEPQDIYIKVPCGPSPSIKRFFALIFIDQFCSKPCQIWQFYVHSLQRVDVTATQGQPSQISVVLRGTQSSRLVRCHSSHVTELEVNPKDPFMLMANAVQELHLTVNPLSTGSKLMFLNVVDTEFHQLVKSWLICAACKQPVISKAFEVQIKVGGGKGSNKRISFTNPYPVNKQFSLKSDRPDLIQLKEDAIMLGSSQSHNIGLRFVPQQSPRVEEILIFINNREGKNEETFCVKALYIL